MRANLHARRIRQTEARKFVERERRFVRIEPLENRRMMSVSITRSIDHQLMVSTSYSHYDSTGTILTDVIIAASEVCTTTNGKTTYSQAMVDLSYSVSNEVGGYFVTVAENNTTTPTMVNIDPNLHTAHVVADVQLLDLNGVVYSPHIDMYWRANGSVQTSNSKTFSYDGAGTAVVEKMSGSGVTAISCGTLSVPATSEFAAVANAAPGVSNSGEIQKVNDGTFTFTVSPSPIRKFISKRPDPYDPTW